MADNMTRGDLARRRAQGAQQAMDLYNIVSLNEGKEESVYKDTEGNNSIAIGFNLEEPSNREYLFKKHGLTYDDVVNKGVKLSENQIRDLYNYSMSNAYQDAKLFDPKLDSRPHNVRVAILDLAFNLGRNKLNTFKKMRKALENDDYSTAAAEMKDSKWFDPVKTRGPRMVGIMQNQDNLSTVLQQIAKK
jgi:GH24 family phage-related lysozyme (muramidase)